MVVKKTVAKPAKQAPASAQKGKPVKKPAKQQEPEEDEDEEEEEMMEITATKRKQGLGGNVATKKTKLVDPEDDEEEDDEDYSEDDDDEDLDDEDDEDGESDEEPVKSTPAKKGVTPAKVQAQKGTPAAKQATPAKVGVTPAKATPAKGKQTPGKTQPAKQDSDERFDLFINGLPLEGDRKAMLHKLFGDKGIKLADVRDLPGKKFAFVVLSNPADKDKAFKLDGSNVNGANIKITPYKSERDNSKSVVLLATGVTVESVKAVTGSSEVTCVGPKPVAFVTFPTEKEASDFVKRGTVEIDGKPFKVRLARPSRARNGPKGKGGLGSTSD